MDNNCTNCGRQILVMAFRGTGFCSVNCKKASGIDVGSQGTLTFLTREERQIIEESRNGK